ncbi:MAG: 2Fe-2S iron-sulfur cluster-binding protein [Prochlorothrix sp.]|nr:2Fe-2S iron-sulfur cluster-binding protein [Prochlorothrix sp.]
MTITVRFLPDNVTALAEPGEPLLDVASRAGITIPTGCLMGSCHACEVEMDGEPRCACLTAVPPKESELVVDLYGDPNW